MSRFNIVQPSLVREAGRSSRPFNRSDPAQLISLSNAADSAAEEFIEDEEFENNLLGDEELLADSHLTPKTEPFPISTEAATQDLLLDESSLATVLEILTTIATVEELTILEALTTAQKRQVWSHTPETIKLKLKQIRQAAANPATTAKTVQGWQTLEQADCNQPLLKVGDAVVLLANPKLTGAELIAIWEVVEVHEASARLQSHLGTRNYPISWMVHYPKPISTSA